MSASKPTASDPFVLKTSFSRGLGEAVRRVFLENRWIVPLALLLGGGAAVAGHLADAKRGSSQDLEHEILRWLLLLLPCLLILLIRTRGWKQVVTAASIFLPAAMAWMLRDQSITGIESTVFSGQVPVPEAFLIKRYLITAGLLSPIIVIWMVQRASILDRYIFREFAFPFVFCLIAFYSIWLVFDLNDNLSDFREHSPSIRDLLVFYFVQIPHIFTKLADAAVLISTVYALSRLSQSNEFIAMLGSGRSLGRTLMPLFLSGAYISFIYLIFNFQWAPQGEGKKESLLDQFSGDQKTAIATKHLYVNKQEGRTRTWYIGEIPLKLEAEGLRFIDIQEQDADQRRTRAIEASSATWDNESRRWSFHRAHVTLFPGDGTAPQSKYHEWHHENNWGETPWQLINQRMEPDYLGVPGLLSYVRTNRRDGLPPALPYLTTLYHRWAAPWGCFTIIFIAAPLGIVYSRRGILGGVASAIFLFGAIIFLTELFLSLSKGGYLPALAAAWLANGIFLVLGGIFLYLRARNRSVRLPRLRALRV